MPSIKSAYTDERKVLQLIKEKDQLAFEYLYDKYSAALFGIILKKTTDQKTAEQILEKVFLTIWQNAAEYNEKKQAPFTWLYQVVLQSLSILSPSASFESVRSATYYEAQSFPIGLAVPGLSPV